MDMRSIYATTPANGWLPWGLVAPMVALLLILPSLASVSLLLEARGLLDTKGDPVDAVSLMAFLALPFSALGLVLLAWVKLVERRPLATIGLTLPGGGVRFLCGYLVGVGAICAIVFSSWMAGGYTASGYARAFGDADSLVEIAILLGCFVLQSSVEEMVFRGWLLSAITRRWNLVAAVVLSSCLFALLHFTPHQSWLVSANLLLFALFACSWSIATNNVWGAMGWHAGWNWLLATGFEVPVTGLGSHTPALVVALRPSGPNLLTGGPQGPEGSIFCTLFFAVGIAFFVWRVVAQRRRPDASDGERLSSH